MLVHFPDQAPIPVRVIDAPVPLPACIHERCLITALGNVAVVRCDSCPAQWTTDVREIKPWSPLPEGVIEGEWIK